jgi:hypothetical protein
MCLWKCSYGKTTVKQKAESETMPDAMPLNYARAGQSLINLRNNIKCQRFDLSIGSEWIRLQELPLSDA